MLKALFRYKFPIVLFGILYWFLFLRFVPQKRLPVSPETTYFTAPLDNAGYVDFDLALNEQARIPPDRNAALPLLKIFGPAVVSSDAEDIDDFCLCLGIASESFSEGVFRELETSVASFGSYAVPSSPPWPDSDRRAFRQPWSREEFPMIALAPENWSSR